jgi:hypothetical protein
MFPCFQVLLFLISFGINPWRKQQGVHSRQKITDTTPLKSRKMHGFSGRKALERQYCRSEKLKTLKKA